MLVVLGGVALVVVLAIAAVVIGRESSRLSAEAPRPVFDFDEAVAWVADELGFEVSAVLSHDDVRRILRWNLDFLQAAALPASAGPEGADGQHDAVVVGGVEAVGSVLVRARAAGLDYTAAQVEAVLDAQFAYLQLIGALGPAESGEPPAT